MMHKRGSPLVFLQQYSHCLFGVGSTPLQSDFAMPGLEHDVHLSRSAPFHIDGGQLFFYDVIHSEIMSRSSVLSCVAEGGGEAKLPSSVTVSDFRMWLTAVTDGDTVFRSRSFVSICAIIKVVLTHSRLQHSLYLPINVGL